MHDSLTGLPDVVTLTIDESEPVIRTLADLLGEHATTDRPGSDIALPALVDLLLVHLLRVWRDRHGAEHGAIGDDPLIARVLRTVRADPGRLWSVRQLSGLAGISRGAFTRRFTAAAGETPRAYLIRRRLDHGTQLLRYTQQPLAAIAEQLGYASGFSFSAAFSRQFGIAPGRFRQRERTIPHDTGPAPAATTTAAD